MKIFQTNSFPDDAVRMATTWILVAVSLSLVTGCPFVFPLECEGDRPRFGGPDPALVCDPDSASCGPGAACMLTGCVPSHCFCDSLTGTWACTADCGSWWECLPDCNGNGQSDLEEGGGACELADGCLDTLSECCDNLGGTYLGDGIACPVAGDQEALDQNRQLWDAAGILTYHYRCQRVCECQPEDARPVIVLVQNDAITGATYADTGQSVDTDHLARLSTINELFDVIQESINDGAESIVVEYDPVLGYPVDVWIDHDFGVADEETMFTVQYVVPDVGS